MQKVKQKMAEIDVQCPVPYIVVLAVVVIFFEKFIG
jgi:hypothetical protein